MTQLFNRILTLQRIGSRRHGLAIGNTLGWMRSREASTPASLMLQKPRLDIFRDTSVELISPTTQDIDVVHRCSLREHVGAVGFEPT